MATLRLHTNAERFIVLVMGGNLAMSMALVKGLTFLVMHHPLVGCLVASSSTRRAGCLLRRRRFVCRGRRVFGLHATGVSRTTTILFW